MNGKTLFIYLEICQHMVHRPHQAGHRCTKAENVDNSGKLDVTGKSTAVVGRRGNNVNPEEKIGNKLTETIGVIFHE